MNRPRNTKEVLEGIKKERLEIIKKQQEQMEERNSEMLNELSVNWKRKRENKR